MRAARASLLLVTLASASAWRVGFEVELRAEVRLSSILNFGADGGSVHASFTLRRPPCSPALAGAECWAPTERLYMVVVDAAQWEGMRDTFRGDTDLDCQQPSAARAELSFLRWRDNFTVALFGKQEYRPLRKTQMMTSATKAAA